MHVNAIAMAVQYRAVQYSAILELNLSEVATANQNPFSVLQIKLSEQRK
jgi:hypothetical protein